METRGNPSNRSTEALWQQLSAQSAKYSDFAYPKVSIIIPTFNSAKTLPLTFDSLLAQDYPDYEILVVDGGSTDRTLQTVKSYHRERIRIYSVSYYGRYEMLNKGITHANGLYLNFLFPGDFYLHYQTLKLMMDLALDNAKPNLTYCGCVLHETNTNIKILNRPLTLELLKSGRQPTSIQSCWFRADVFRKIGKFPTDYVMRGGYDLLCRFCLHEELRFVSTSRVLTDYDLRGTGRQKVFQHFWETARTIYARFGVMIMLKWLLFQQRDLLRYIKLWFSSLRVAFLGR